MWPAGSPRPGTSTLSVPARAIRTATVVVPVGAQGQVSIGNAAGVGNLVIDAVGYTAIGGGSRMLMLPTTVRAFDSRTTGGTLPSGSSRTVVLPALAGVSESQITGVIAQVSAGGATRGGWLEAHPFAAPFTATTMLTYQPGGSTVTLAVLGADQGKLIVTNRGSAVDVTIDVVGVITADPGATRQVAALPPVRAYDSRATGGALPAGTVRDAVVTGKATGVPADAAAVLVNLTASAGPAGTAMTAWAYGQARPSRVDLQVDRLGTQANLALVPIGSDGRISLWTSSGAPVVVVDVVGYLR